MQIYESEGYNPRDAAKLILEKNLYGLDIDRRATQLAYFSLMMKGRQYNRRIFQVGIHPQVYHPAGWQDGEEYGSLVKVDELPPQPNMEKEQLAFSDDDERDLRVWNFKRLLTQQYDIVVTNPPYRGISDVNSKLSNFVKRNYPDSKSDLFAVFIEKCGELLKTTGYQAMITQHAWMFLSSFEKLRHKLLQRDMVNMAHLGARAFEEIGGEVVQTTAFVMSKRDLIGYEAAFVRLVDFNSQQTKEEAFLSGSDRHTAKKGNFSKIPGSPVAYWVSDAILDMYAIGNTFDKIGNPKVGMQTSNNEKYLRRWFEINYFEFNGTSLGKKWIKYLKGGAYRKWYGNLEYLLFYNYTPTFIQQQPNSRVLDEAFLTMPKCTWTDLTSGSNSFRFAPDDTFYDISGHSFLPSREDQFWLLGYANSKIFSQLLKIFNSTFHCQVGDVARVSVPQLNQQQKSIISELSKNNVGISRSDWDSFETSWDFLRHPLVCGERTIAAAFAKWQYEAEERFNTLKANEEELNRIFIDIYGLQDELTPEVEDKDVTVRKADLGREIRSLISYAVGCMLGRYSLDTDGLAYAGGDWDGTRYQSYMPDEDNVLPICDDEYFNDDIMDRFVDFIRVVYGVETLEENLTFIAEALGGRGTPREIIRTYFLNDFYKDHCKIYQKRPIYWLFDSGKKNGFKALIYMHRYSPDLLARLRTDYVHEQQERYRTQLSHLTTALPTATGVARTQLVKQQAKLTDQLKEITGFEEKVHHLADQNIMIDLDDGVKQNYPIFADVLAKL